MKNILLLMLVILILSSCARSSRQTAFANISQSISDRVVDGVTTKVEVISILGKPNGSLPTGNNNSMAASYVDGGAADPFKHVLHYKNCILKSASQAKFITTEVGNIEICDTFSALLNDDDVVIAHAYFTGNIIDNERLKKLKLNVSDKKAVIRTLGGPSNIVASGDKEVYLYETCIDKTKDRSNNPIPFGGIVDRLSGKEQRTSRRTCQQAGVVINQTTGKVLKTNFISFADLKKMQN